MLYEDRAEKCCALRIAANTSPAGIARGMTNGCSPFAAAHCRFFLCNRVVCKGEQVSAKRAAPGQTQSMNHDEQNVTNVSIVRMCTTASRKPKSADLPIAYLVMYICRQSAKGLEIDKQSVSDLPPTELCHTRTVIEDLCFCRYGFMTQVWLK